MELYVKDIPNLHLFFRNRVAQLHQIMNLHNIDGLILLTCKNNHSLNLAFDCMNSPQMHRIVKWLLFGCTSVIELEQTSIPHELNELVIVISRSKVSIFSTNKTGKFFQELTSKINNAELFITTKKEEESTDNFQVLKIAKFIEFTMGLKRIGIPLDYEISKKLVKLEQWPLIQATAIDFLKLGFFTMSHEIVDIRKDVEILYHRLDLNACFSLVNKKSNILEVTMVDFFNYFQKDHINKRLDLSELYLNENQNLELIKINYDKEKKTTFEYMNDLPDPRILFGVNSNNTFDQGCSNEEMFKTEFIYKIPAFHMTYENMDPTTGMRIGRTLMLYNLQKTFFDFNDENAKYEFIPTLIYKEAFYLFNLYYILVSFYRKYQFDIILKKMKVGSIKEDLKDKLNAYIYKIINSKNFDFVITSDNIIVDTKEYMVQRKIGESNSSVSELQNSENKIIVLRIEVKDLISPFCHKKIGSLLFCDSFLFCYGEMFNITSDILPFKFSLVSTRHFKLKEYNHNQVLQAVTDIKMKDIEFKGISFYKDEYNIPYVFPDGKQDGLDHNQMFIFYEGKINLYNDYKSSRHY